MGLSFFLRGVLLVTGNLKRFKPGVHKRVHLLLSGFLWMAVGLFLLLRGGRWLIEAGDIWLILPALFLGSGKSLLILDKVAENGVRRILQFGDNTCLGAVYSFRTWLLVLVMMGSGFFLRQTSLPRTLLGFVYAAIGWSLFLSSRLAWRAWLKGNAEKVTGM